MTRICFDLDETLVTSDPKYAYETAKPIPEMIEFAQKLKKEGHIIIINTARRMNRHSGNVGAVIADVGKITLETIEKYEIPCDELYFGKPSAELYIDDKAHNHLVNGIPDWIRFDKGVATE